MYLTAHRVRSPSSGKHGINSFLYEHGSTPAVEGMSLQSSDVRRVAEQQPGTLKTDWIEVVPGGNQVLSYFDIVAQDSTTIEDIEAALRSARSALLKNMNSGEA